ncbi:hypothetical protein K466DRAFT_585088 [Polyporus arcularius HHB13444]|uniref:Uncharacterized protein n=1 Tax=Polyporus arcularius HHB13444 TaxID=1314778 RepID=A0A5C3PHZ3_9APHY|nr:hypothetical protein K466DRAFT_585088 [Polyporus arcularius HHB13444]
MSSPKIVFGGSVSVAQLAAYLSWTLPAACSYLVTSLYLLPLPCTSRPSLDASPACLQFALPTAYSPCPPPTPPCPPPPPPTS